MIIMLGKFSEMVPGVKGKRKQITLYFIMLFMIFSMIFWHSPPVVQAQDYGLDWEFQHKIVSGHSYGGALTWGRDKFVGAGSRPPDYDENFEHHLNVFFTDANDQWQEASGSFAFLLKNLKMNSIITSYSPSQKWVIVGEEGTVLTNDSLDLDSVWVKQTTPTSNNLYDVVEAYTLITDAYIDSLFAIGANGTVISSFYGGDWKTEVVPGEADSFYSVTKHSTQPIHNTLGSLVMVGESGVVRVVKLDKDLNLDWKFRDKITKGDLYGVTHGTPIEGNLTLVAVGEGGVIMTSTDEGYTWVSRNSQTDKNLRDVTWTGKLFVAVGNSGTIVSSPNGFNWTVNDIKIETPVIPNFVAVKSSEDNVIAITSFHDIYRAKNILDLEITLSTSPLGSGSVIGGGTYAYGKKVDVKAEANEGFEFVSWTESFPEGKIVSTDVSYSFTATRHRHLVANFKQLGGWGPRLSSQASEISYRDEVLAATFGHGTYLYKDGSWGDRLASQAAEISYSIDVLAATFSHGTYLYSGAGLWGPRLASQAEAISYRDKLLAATFAHGTYLHDGNSWGERLSSQAEAISYHDGVLAATFGHGTYLHDGNSWGERLSSQAEAISYHDGVLAATFAHGTYFYFLHDGKWSERIGSQASAISYHDGVLAATFSHGTYFYFLHDGKWSERIASQAEKISYHDRVLAATFSHGTYLYYLYF